VKHVSSKNRLLRNAAPPPLPEIRINLNAQIKRYERLTKVSITNMVIDLKYHEAYFSELPGLTSGIPSHDAFRAAFSIIPRGSARRLTGKRFAPPAKKHTARKSPH
jgi:hypothetical protein